MQQAATMAARGKNSSGTGRNRHKRRRIPHRPKRRGEEGRGMENVGVREQQMIPGRDGGPLLHGVALDQPLRRQRPQ